MEHGVLVVLSQDCKIIEWTFKVENDYL